MSVQIMTDEQIEEMKKEIRQNVVNELKINKMSEMSETMQQVAENTAPEKMTKRQLEEKISKIHDPYERMKLISENMELLGY